MMGVQNWMNNKGSGKVGRTQLGSSPIASTPLGGKSGGKATPAGKGGVKASSVASSNASTGKGSYAAAVAEIANAGKGSGGSKGGWSNGGSNWGNGGGNWGNGGGGDAAGALALMALASMMQGAGGGGWGGYQRTFKVDKSGGELGEFIGTIKSFGLRRNYGFIECPDVAAKGFGDIFLHGNEKKGYREGQTVKFTCVVNKEGKAVAIDLKSGLK
eukprot:TRINITY_DN348_c0_g1_i1.p1 TRINITY_DN348_c0_g1~~TRINITY_DN348_c0_g1_i1.p1  ORF type:complete len:215 (-),score=74.96 TRINITY_DN348_c0_g1_i1:129-773(-)